MTQNNQCIVVFAREPIIGTVKSRLSPALDPQQRLALYEQLLTQSISVATSLSDADCVLFGTPTIAHPMFKSFARSHDVKLALQSDGDLGERMEDAANIALEQYQRVLIMGSDCPFITLAYLESAYRELDQSEIVIGPANDGGFVLIACKKTGVLKPIFEKVRWGESDVLESVIKNAQVSEADYTLLKPLDDIDRPEDLDLLEKVTWFA